MKEIFVDDFTLRIQYDSNNGEWNLSAMKIQLPGGGSRPAAASMASSTGRLNTARL